MEIRTGPTMHCTAGIRVSRSIGRRIPRTSGVTPSSCARRFAMSSANDRPPADSKVGPVELHRGGGRGVFGSRVHVSGEMIGCTRLGHCVRPSSDMTVAPLCGAASKCPSGTESTVLADDDAALGHRTEPHAVAHARARRRFLGLHLFGTHHAGASAPCRAADTVGSGTAVD